jgi:dCTP deaminase
VILSNVEIHNALDAGDIVIDPEPRPRLPSLANPKSPYDTTAVNLTLSSSLSVSTDDPPMAFDLRKPGIAKLLKSVYNAKEIDPEGGYSLKPGVFVLGNTRETINLPIREGRPVYAARVEGRSSFARCGLLVHFTAPTIHAGFMGTITFEIMNLGKSNILLSTGLPIAQLIFESVAGVPVRSDSQFQGQRTPPGSGG